MNRANLLRNTIYACIPLAFSLCLASTPAAAQNGQAAREFAGAHLQSAVYDGSTRAGWYSFPGQQPKLHFSGDKVRITSRQHSTVLLSRGDAAGSTAEVSLAHPPMSTSSISGLAVLSDAQHALAIGLDAGNIVLWQLDPEAARIVVQQPVNGSSPLEFRVTGGSADNVRFFWRHPSDPVWHPLGDAASSKALASWNEPLRYGLLLDGPQGSQVTFSNFRAVNSDTASNVDVPAAAVTAALVQGQ